MDGVHDMGGMDGFGKVEPEPNEPVFHHRWEGRVLAMSRAIGVFRAWTIDTSRYAIELMAPSIYLTSDGRVLLRGRSVSEDERAHFKIPGGSDLISVDRRVIQAIKEML